MSQSHNRFLIIIILGALSTISPFAIDMYLPAFPQIAAALGTSTARISLSIASYFAGLAAGQLFYGPLLDRVGRKLPLYAGLTLFLAASLLCLVSRTVEWLVAMRFVQALGGCAAQVAAMAMVRDFFPVHETAKIRIDNELEGFGVRRQAGELIVRKRLALARPTAPALLQDPQAHHIFG